jgi:hypothetical protein
MSDTRVTYISPPRNIYTTEDQDCQMENCRLLFVSLNKIYLPEGNWEENMVDTYVCMLACSLFQCYVWCTHVAFVVHDFTTTTITITTIVWKKCVAGYSVLVTSSE